MKKIRFSTVVTALVIAAAAIMFTGCGSSDSGSVEQHDYTGFVMGTVLSETIYTTGEDITEDVEKELSDTEDRLVSWRKSGSEIAVINASAGKKSVKVSDDTAGYLDSVLKMAKDSGGAFDPTIGKITRLWGFDGETPKIPEESKIKALLKDTGYEKVKLSGNSVRLNEDTSLDLGAAGKGLGCDRIKDMFDKDGSVTGAVINIGGSSIMTYGSKPDKSAWNVAVTDPRDDGDYLGTVEVEDESYISTSGDYEKYFVKDGVRYHHIIDPETGYPAKSGLISVTVVCDSGIVSDMLATACFVLGKEKGMELAEKYDAAAVFADSDKNVYMNKKAKNIFTLTKDGYTAVE